MLEQTAFRSDLISLSEYVFARTSDRLTGLTDEEYFWEPVPECWTVRIDEDGGASADWADDPDQAPFTTISWRLWHLTDCYGSDRNELWLRGTDDGAGDARCAARPNATAALSALNGAYRWWQDLIDSLSPSDLIDRLGPIAGPYADSDKGAFVLHQIDEMIHHGAELAVLLDLHQHSAV